jgi:hypothetical protein
VADVARQYSAAIRPDRATEGRGRPAINEKRGHGGCNQQVPLNLCNQVMLGQPAGCKTCGRLLYLPE